MPYSNNYSVKHSLKQLFMHRYERYLPTAFDESQSLLEKMNKLIEAQNQLINVVNSHTEWTNEKLERAFDIIDTNLKGQLEKFRDDLAEQKLLYEEIRDKIHSDLLPNSVKQKLEEWLLDGTLTGFIEDSVFPSFVERMIEFENRLEDYEQMEEVSISRFYDLAVEESDGTLNWTKPLEKALEVSDYVVVPEGEYTFDPFTMSPELSNKTIVGRGDATKIYVKSGADAFKATGTEENIRRVTRDYQRGTNVIYLESTAGLSVGDDILLQSERNCLSLTDSGADWVLGAGTGSNPQRVPFGEFGIIERVHSDRIELVNTPIYPHYGATNSGQSESVQSYSTVKRVNFAKNITIKDITVGSLRSGFVLRTKLAKNVVLDGVKFIDSNETVSARGVSNIQLSYGCEVRNSIYESPRGMGFDDSNYWEQNPYKMVSAQNSGFYNCQGINSGQMVDLSFLTGYMPNTGCYIKNCRSVSASRSGFTTHGGNYLLQFTGNYVEGAIQGFSHRGRGAIISDNVLIGTSYGNVGSNLNSGISLYQHGAVDNIVTGNVIRNFANGVSYSDGNGSRAEYLNTIISDNTFQNCSRAVWMYRYHTGGNAIPRTDMGVTISDNVFNMVNNTDNSAVYAIQLNERNGGITIKGNTFKGIPSGTPGSGQPRTNNFTGVGMDGNNDNVRIFDNVFMDIDYAVRHEGTRDVYTEGVYPDGVQFYLADNKRVNVRLDDFFRTGVIHTGKQFMTSKLNSDSILTGYGVEQIPLKFKEITGTGMTSGGGAHVVLGDALYEFNWHFTLYGLTGTPSDSVDIRVKIGDTPIIKYLVRDNEEQSISIKFLAKKGDILSVTAQKSSAGLNCRIEDYHVDNRASLYVLSEN